MIELSVREYQRTAAAPVSPELCGDSRSKDWLIVEVKTLLFVV